MGMGDNGNTVRAPYTEHRGDQGCSSCIVIKLRTMIQKTYNTVHNNASTSFAASNVLNRKRESRSNNFIQFSLWIVEREW